jgi:hypothetical protein
VSPLFLSPFFVLCILEGKLRSFLKADRVLEVNYERWAERRQAQHVGIEALLALTHSGICALTPLDPSDMLQNGTKKRSCRRVE